MRRFYLPDPCIYINSASSVDCHGQKAHVVESGSGDFHRDHPLRCSREMHRAGVRYERNNKQRNRLRERRIERKKAEEQGRDVLCRRAML